MPSGVCKADPSRPRMLTLRHQTSGATKAVEYLGMFGSPLRAHVFWPGGFDSFGVSPKTGALVAENGAGEGVRSWRLTPDDHEYVRAEAHRELTRQRAVNDSTKP